MLDSDFKEIITHLEQRQEALEQLMHEQEWDFTNLSAIFTSTVQDIRRILGVIATRSPQNDWDEWIDFMKIGSYNFGVEMCIALQKDFLPNNPMTARDAGFTALELYKETVKTIKNHRLFREAI